MKIIAVTQARVGSTRLPGKVLKSINDISLLQIHLERIALAQKPDKIIVATTNEAGVEAICEVAAALGIDSYRGNTTDVLDRFYNAVKEERPDYVIRLTSDCPLIDPEIIDKVVSAAVTKRLDYASNTMATTFPDGMDVEVFTFHALEKAWTEAKLKSDREHVTPYIWRNSTFKGGGIFLSDNVTHETDYGNIRLTVDEPADLELVTQLIMQLGSKAGWKEYVAYLLLHPDLLNLNSNIIHNEGYIKSLLNDN
ncbi:glycosyltransferase family protein [Chitinophaga oryzae]|uniref:Glycosyltransferase family protein n=1 Tax=Chitinophaga oryzae TaxID=2725414 RepID=A0AAE7D970_9BACT|nr:glycosyltransferase family protein [Chitinophaga oryzae]QJB34113.1 glycosyltransferase family protein [Chitinophaga oryzae]QJB40632.1 glycosyltransferase family protein [Chitinophaga oryzae]